MTGTSLAIRKIGFPSGMYFQDGSLKMISSFWFFHVAWASSQHGGWDTRVSISQRKTGRSGITSYDLACVTFTICQYRSCNKSPPSFKGTGHRWHHLMGKWQGSRKAYGIGYIVISIFAENNQPQSKFLEIHTGCFPSLIYTCNVNLFLYLNYSKIPQESPSFPV